MESIARLRVVLLNALSGRGVQHGEQELFDELMVHKSCLVNLFDVGPRNPQEQRELESGKTVLNGRPAAVNADFARQAVFLSQQLETSERYIAGLLHSVTAENPNIQAVDCIELTIAQFHQRRRHLADCLDYIFEAAELADPSDTSSVFYRIGEFASKDLILPGASQAGGLAHRIVREIQNLGNAVARADAARRGARTITVPPSAQGATPSLGYDILNSRYESLKYERRCLATCLSIIARLGHLSPNEIKAIVDWLSTAPNQSMTFYLLTSVLSAFDPVADSSRANLATNSDLMTYMTKKLATATEWKDPGLKATILLKWTLFLTDARHRNAQLEHRSGFKTDELETQVWNAVQGDAFKYLALVVLQLERRRGSSPVASFANTLALSAEQQELRELPTEDFIPVVFTAFEILVRSLITHASSELRKIKQRQEDLVLASARTDRTRTGPARFASSLAPEAERPAVSPRSDIAMLYTFIGLLYSALPPERALQFWGSNPHGDSLTYMEYLESTMGRLPAFLQWAVWSTQVNDVSMSTALYDMLAGLANGQQCSELAYNFMARGGGEVIPGGSLPSASGSGPSVSWSVVFGLLDSWATSTSNHTARPTQPVHAFGNTLGMSSFNNPPPPTQPQTITIGPKEVLLAQSFLRLLSNVVSHSVAVRIAVASHVHFRAMPVLVSLIPLGIPLELKGAVFDTLAAFCEPGAGAPGVQICHAVWTLMERHEVINLRVGPSSGFPMNLPPVKGVEMELDEIEALHRMYPATIPFLRLLSTLIHTPKRIPLKDWVVDSGSVNTIPETLGQPYRLPGIGPYITFVIDNVFANIPNREYLQPSDRWQTNDLCLAFIERSVASFDLESLVRASDDSQIKGDTIISLLIHPGYEIVKRLLTNTPLQSSILTYVVEGLAGFEKGLADEEPYFGSTIVRVLRIILRVLEIQDIFLDVLLPHLHEFDSAPLIGTVHPRSYFTKFDQALSYSAQYAPALAAYVSYATHPELVLLSVKIISTLSSSSAFSSLYSLIERSDESDRIMAGFTRILGSETAADVLLAENVAEQSTGAGAPDGDEKANSPALQQAIRLAVLQLFIKNTEAGRPYPNIAHFFLFGDAKTEHVIQDPHALGARHTCIHVILDLANTGVPRLDAPDDDPGPDSDPLFVVLPGLAELFYRIIYQLCTHSRTSEFTMRYLRTREDFFARQLAAIPSLVPGTVEDGIDVQYADGARVRTTVPALSSFLRLRSWIFDLAALDLHVLTSKGLFKGVAELLDILFGNDSDTYPGSQDGFREVGQSHLRIIEFVQSLAFDWSDTLKVEPKEMPFLGQLDLNSCVRRDATGCEIIDRTALISLLSSARRTLIAQNSVVTDAQSAQLHAETIYILESCAVENHRREVAHAKSTGYESWKRLLDMTLTKCFNRLPHDHRENMLFDLLHVVPTILRSEDIQESTAVLLSEAVLSAVTKLREDRRHQVLVQSASGDADAGSLPAERLYAILRSILECIVDNNRVELVRGNLYAAIINYVHLITPTSDFSDDSKGPGLAMSLAASTTRDDFLFNESQALVPVSQAGRPHSSTVSLELGSLSLMKGVMERLVATISRDAIDGSEVWKTIAFMLLDSLVQLSGLEKQHIVLTALVRHGILTNFVRGIKESDLRLQAVLKPDPDDLNPLYVYEAKMSLFVRMAQTRLGAERLLEAQLIPILSQCDYLDAQPEADQSFMDQDSFLPSAVQRYHQLFMPALQLVDGMLATLGTKHATVSNQALDFLSSHSATIVILLKNETDQLPLALVDEMHLLVSLCAGVLTHVPKSELLSPHSGFGAIHAAVLSIATKSIGSGSWLAAVTPQTDAEMLSASVFALGYVSDTKFDVSKRQKERLMRKSVVEYIGAASEFTEPDITPVLSPITTTPRHDERGSHFLATIPTVGDALDALTALCGDLAQTLKQIADLSAELAAKEHVSVENIDELLPDADPAFLRGLDIPQKRALVCRELARERRVAEGEARTLLGTLEMVLLLLWRHLVYYAEGQHMNAPNPPPPSTILRGSTAHALRLLSPPEPEAFRADVAQRLGPVLSRLAGLDLSGEWLRASAGYVEIMGRRLRDSAGILDDGEEGMQTS
ncbi:nucleoporin Nup186/Nup192/Nup205 [Mycena polygramma]|nr:nucleoporin Nup186/Nup192/Nup205 [Mycena polygramma]